MVELAGIGTLQADVAYGGTIHCLVEAEVLGLTLARSEARDLVRIGDRGGGRRATAGGSSGESRHPHD
jgi:proline racemase